VGVVAHADLEIVLGGAAALFPLSGGRALPTLARTEEGAQTASSVPNTRAEPTVLLGRAKGWLENSQAPPVASDRSDAGARCRGSDEMARRHADFVRIASSRYTAAGPSPGELGDEELARNGEERSADICTTDEVTTRKLVHELTTKCLARSCPRHLRIVRCNVHALWSALVWLPTRSRLASCRTAKEASAQALRETGATGLEPATSGMTGHFRFAATVGVGSPHFMRIIGFRPGRRRTVERGGLGRLLPDCCTEK